MTIESDVHTHLDRIAAPHTGGHICLDGGWYNEGGGARRACPTRQSVAWLRTSYVPHMEQRVHESAHDLAAVDEVLLGATGLTATDLPAEERDGWRLTFRRAIETLAAHLDPSTSLP